MKEWTFLLQKYGDRSWLSLDSPDVEILEGRYRIVVQTDHPNTDINIRICHLATEEDPPKRRIQKRTNRTNANGLMVVAPFTQLQPGNWELSCFLSDPMSDLVGDMLHKAVRLRVSAYVEAESDVWDDPVDDTPVEAMSESASDVITTEPQHFAQSAHPLSSGLESTEVTHSVRDMAAMNVEIAQALGFSMDRLVEMTDQLSHKLIEEIFQEFNISATVEGEPIAAADSSSEAPEAPIEALPPVVPEVEPVLDVNQLRITLAQDYWMATRGESLAIAGRLELAPATDELEARLPLSTVATNPDLHQLEPELEGAVPQEIQIQLRDPQTSKVLFHACQSFPKGVPPIPFTFLCNLPDDLTTHLLLGEVLIVGALPGAESVLVTLKTLNFTVTVDPQVLVAELQKVQTAIAQKAEQDELLDVVAQFSERLQKEKERHTLDLSFLNMAAPVPQETAPTEETVTSVETTPKHSDSRKQILPPLLYKPDTEQATKRKLELPVFAGVGTGGTGQSGKSSFSQPAIKESDPVFGESEAEMESMVLPDFPQAGDRLEMSEDRDFAIVSNSSAQPEPQLPENGMPTTSSEPVKPAPAADGQADLAKIDELSSPIRKAFQALNLQDKFLTRLSSMAADTELTTLLKLTQPQSEEKDDEGEKVAVAVEPTPVAELIAEADSTEVVVDDDPSWRDWVKRAGSRTKVVETHVALPTINPLVLPPDQSVPLPTLELGIDEIVAGKPINVRVKLPNLLPKIYVKLWINDRQTRTMLDGPRWLVDFLPNGFDELEATTQITVPFGSTNMRLEAIAVEMQTQRESQKVSLDCEVLPADLPDELFDEFEY